MASILERFPSDVLLYVCDQLELQDIDSLSRTCSHFSIHFHRETRDAIKGLINPKSMVFESPPIFKKELMKLDQLAFRILIDHAAFRYGPDFRWATTVTRSLLDTWVGCGRRAPAIVHTWLQQGLIAGHAIDVAALISLGARLDKMPSSINQALETVLLDSYAEDELELIINHGAQVAKVPMGPDALLWEIFHSSIPLSNWRYPYLLRHCVGSLSVPAKLNEALEKLFLGTWWSEDKMQFLLRRGAKFNKVPSGLDCLLMKFLLKFDHMYDRDRNRKVELLVRHGADVAKMPRGIDSILEEKVMQGTSWFELRTFSHLGAKFANVPAGVNQLLEDIIMSAPPNYAIVVEELLRAGAKFRNTPSGPTKLLEAVHSKSETTYFPWISHLFRAGATFTAIPGGVNKLLEFPFTQQDGVSKLRIEHLVLQGAELAKMPSGLHAILEKVIRNPPRRGWRYDLIEILLEHGASFAKTPSGPHKLLEDVVLMANRCADISMVEYLLEGGANFTKVPSGLNGLLEKKVMSTNYGPDSVFKLMFKAGADPAKVPSGVNTLLEQLSLREVFYERDYGSRLLIKHGADPTHLWVQRKSRYGQGRRRMPYRCEE